MINNGIPLENSRSQGANNYDSGVYDYGFMWEGCDAVIRCILCGWDATVWQHGQWICVNIRA